MNRFKLVTLTARQPSLTSGNPARRGRDDMPSRIAVVALAVPLIFLGVMLANPGMDHSWYSNSFHFWVVSAASLLAAFACLLLIISARTMRETRIMFLALSFFTLGMLFSVHGLATPGVLFDEPYASLGRSPWLATLGAGVFATLSVLYFQSMERGHANQAAAGHLPRQSGARCLLLHDEHAFARLAERFPLRRRSGSSTH